MMKRFSVWLFVVIIVTLPTALFGMVKWYEHRYTRLPVLGPKGHTLINFRLQDEEGRMVGLENWERKLHVVNYFFTHCSTVCPKMNANLKNVEQQFEGDT